MTFTEIIYVGLNFLGWVWFFFKKPFIWFGKLNWKAKLVVVVILLLIFDKLRFWLFSLLIWLMV